MVGNQKPRIQIEPKRVGSDGQGAAMLVSEYCYPLDEWQRLVLDCWLGTDENGNYTTTSAGLSVSRQNGKNFIIEARELYGLIVNGERILHTAHQVRTYKKAFRRLCNIFSDKRHPEVVKAVKQIRLGIGEESIELNNGGIIEFTSRSRQCARGYDGISLVVYDEAQELTEDQAEALMSVLSASANGTRQVIYAGTPPYPGCVGTVFKRFRQSCIDEAGRGEVSRSAWHEWSIAADSITDIDINDKKLWYEANPALSLPRSSSLNVEFTEEECKTLSPDGFARERLGVWFKPVAKESNETAIDTDLWDSCISEEEKPQGKTAYGIKFSIDGARVVLAGACIDKDNNARISLIEDKPLGAGLSWLSTWLNDRYKVASCCVIDGRNGADILVDKISGTWVFKGSVIKPSAQNVVTADTLLINELNEHTLSWYKGQEVLRESAITATKRKIGSGWGFGGPGSEYIEACALALWGCRTSKRNPQKQMRIG